MKKNTTTTATTTVKNTVGRKPFVLDPKRENKLQIAAETLLTSGVIGKVAQIKTLYKQGFKRQELVAFGFSKVTVYRQAI